MREVRVTDPVRTNCWANGPLTLERYEKEHPEVYVVSTRPDGEGGLFLTVLDRKER